MLLCPQLTCCPPSAAFKLQLLRTTREGGERCELRAAGGSKATAASLAAASGAMVAASCRMLHARCSVMILRLGREKLLAAWRLGAIGADGSTDLRWRRWRRVDRQCAVSAAAPGCLVATPARRADSDGSPACCCCCCPLHQGGCSRRPRRKPRRSGARRPRRRQRRPGADGRRGIMCRASLAHTSHHHPDSSDGSDPAHHVPPRHTSLSAHLNVVEVRAQARGQEPCRQAVQPHS